MRLQTWLTPCCYLSHFLDLRSTAPSLLRVALSLHPSRLDSTIASRPPGHKSLYFRTHQPHPRLEDPSITLALGWNPDFSRMGRSKNTLRSPALLLFLSLLPLFYIVMAARRPSWNLSYLSIRLLTYRAPPPILVHVHVLHKSLSRALLTYAQYTTNASLNAPSPPPTPRALRLL